MAIRMAGTRHDLGRPIVSDDMKLWANFGVT
ncbi:MAG: hypothetical protein CM15mP74_23650 [Halieaceae bacterium]|nr:MAG: hypothetical protein CM15mP74_23650 [Halieaceae bacterium]